MGFGLLLASSVVFADTKGRQNTAGDRSVVSKKKKELILRLLETNGSRDNIRQVFMQIISRAPEETREEAKELLKADEVLQRLIPVYARYYTEEDIKELIIFYKGPTGRKQLEVIPKIMEDTLFETVQYFKEKVAAQEDVEGL